MVQVGCQMAQVRKKCAHLRRESGIHAMQWRRSVTKKQTCAKTVLTCAGVSAFRRCAHTGYVPGIDLRQKC